jgi:hypothetical protein
MYSDAHRNQSRPIHRASFSRPSFMSSLRCRSANSPLAGFGTKRAAHPGPSGPRRRPSGADRRDRSGRPHPLNRADDPLRLLLLPLTRRPALAARPLRSVDPRDKRQDRYRILSDDHLAGYQPLVRQPAPPPRTDRRAGNPQPGNRRQRPTLNRQEPRAGMGSARLPAGEPPARPH